MDDGILSPWLSTYLNEREANRRLSVAVGLVDLFKGDHTTAFVFEGLLECLALARVGQHPWELFEDEVYVRANYQMWWRLCRLRPKTVYRRLKALESVWKLIKRRTETGTDGRRLLVAVDEKRLQEYWAGVTLGVVVDEVCVVDDDL